MTLNEYKPGSSFPGVIGGSVEQSSPAWPELRRAKEGAPNVLFIVLDDTGFAQLGCYGSPIQTPNLDKLAQNGLRYRNMQTTALCSPTRSCILTGRNHHSNHVAAIMELSSGYPGYDCYIPFENGFLSEILQQHGLKPRRGAPSGAGLDELLPFRSTEPGRALSQDGSPHQGNPSPSLFSPDRLPTPRQLARWQAIQKAKRQGHSLRAIARGLGISRNTVRKYVVAASPPTNPQRPCPSEDEDDDQD